MRLHVGSPELRLQGLGFGRLKHLEVKGFAAFPQAASQLPLLETLRLEAHDTWRPGRVSSLDVQKCKRLRALALKRITVQQLLMPEGCRFAYGFSTISFEFPQLWQGLMRSVLGMAQRIETYVSRQWAGFSANWFKSLHNMRELKLYLATRLRPEHWLMHSMPAHDLPCHILRSINIRGEGMQILVPAGLPNLEELLIASLESLRLTFQDVQATASRLSVFCISGFHVEVTDYQFDELKASFLPRSKIVTDGMVEGKGRPRACIYIHDSSADSLSVKALTKWAHELTHGCRCKACFDCLARGLIWASGNLQACYSVEAMLEHMQNFTLRV